MAVTRKEIADALGLPEATLIAVLSRATLLTQRDAIDSKIANIRAQQSEAMRAAEADIDALNAERAKLQEQLNAL